MAFAAQFWLVVGIVFIATLLYLNLVASFLVVIDYGKPNVTKFGHLCLIWLLPFVGASLVLYFISTHAPELIARLWIPWPFCKALENQPFGGDPKKSLVDHELDTHDGGHSGL